MTPLSTLAAQTVAGWKLVPVEPTERMMDAAIATVEKPCFPQDIYAAMLAAAPSPEALPAGVEAVAIDALSAIAVDEVSCLMPMSDSAIRGWAYAAARIAADALEALTSAPAQEDRT